MTKWNYIKEHYIDKGLKIFPVTPNAKTPMIENWQNDCSCDYFQILYWYNNCPNCNWGLPCTPNDLFVLDLDTHDINKDGIKSYAKISSLLFTLDECKNLSYMTQTTPSGGKHLIFKSNDVLKNVSNGSNVFEKYPGIDIRTDGYILIEPSEINGIPYKIQDNVEIPEMPKKLEEFIITNANVKSEKKKETYKKPTIVEVGDRDNQLFSYINNLYFNTKLDYDEILCLAKNFNDNVLEEPFSEKTIKYKVNKVFDKERGSFFIFRLSDD